MHGGHLAALGFGAGRALSASRAAPLRHTDCRASGMNGELPAVEIQVFLNVVAASGRDPAAFAVALERDGQVHVTGPHGSAFYARGHWITPFSRHLQRGFFDSGAADPAAAAGGQGTSGRAAT